jgi:poly-beta-1,6-N-acetyl-D-glucosamine synthase
MVEHFALGNWDGESEEAVGWNATIAAELSRGSLNFGDALPEPFSLPTTTLQVANLTVASSRRYVVITPVRDEAHLIERTISSMVRQTVLPAEWIIVDDNSHDGTAAVVHRYVSTNHWMRLISFNEQGPRSVGGREIKAFYVGLNALCFTQWGFIVKLDADLELPPTYFEELLRRFQDEPSLGIASGIYTEYHGGSWVPIQMPEYHAAGASKMIRADCFKTI